MAVRPNHEPDDEEHAEHPLPAPGPSWMFEPTRHRGETVRFDGGAVALPHYEHGRLDPLLRASLRSERGALQPLAQRLHTAAAHFAAGEDEPGRAITDLLVVGRDSLEQLGARRLERAGTIDWRGLFTDAKSAPPVPDVVVQRAKKGLPRLPVPTEEDFARTEARARAVLRHLAGTLQERRALAGDLGWIAVSGEDDHPYRPVNVAVTPAAQFSMPLVVWGLPLALRYAVWGTLSRTSKNVLLLHGHSSRLEEVDLVAGRLAAEGYTVIALDLPGCGYSGQLDHQHVLFAEDPVRGDVPLPFAPEPRDPARHSSLYVLRFLLASVRAFVERLFADHDLPPRIALLGGGSLGGNLALLVSELAPHGAPSRHAFVDPRWSFVERVASWSPASLWSIPGLAHGTPHGRSQEPETPDRRRDHFNRWMNVDHTPIAIRQAEQWYRPGWTGKARAIAEGWAFRHEVYSPRFRTWHWIVAHEQVKFSHRGEVWALDGRGLGKSHLALAGGRLLLMAGEHDNFTHTNIYDHVASLGPSIPSAQVLLWKATGHSIHDERPGALASVLDRFAREAI